MTEIESTKPHWSERARSGLKKTAELVADHGISLGMAGTSVLIVGAGACGLMAAGTADPHYAASLSESGAILLLSATAQMASSYVAEEMARAYLGRDKAVEVFGPIDDSLIVMEAEPKGAVKIKDDPTFTPIFQKALQKTLESLEKSPNAKATFVGILKRSPEAREALTKQAMAGSAGTGNEVRQVALDITRRASSTISPTDKGNDPAPG